MESVRYLQWPRPPRLPASTPRTPGTIPTGPFAAFLVSGSGDGLRADVTTLTVDDLPPGEVLIEVAWSAVNYKDGMVDPTRATGWPAPRRWCRASTWWAP